MNRNKSDIAVYMPFEKLAKMLQEKESGRKGKREVQSGHTVRNFDQKTKQHIRKMT